MNTRTKTYRELVAIDADELFTALDALQPSGQQQKHALFQQAYPGILRAIARKVPQKDILSTLSRSGLKLHPIRYREMLETERKLRDERGERIYCETCGSALDPMAAGDSSTQESPNQSSQLGDAIQAIAYRT
jgi:hypothetical protein